jgi:hypothetical protein
MVSLKNKLHNRDALDRQLEEIFDPLTKVIVEARTIIDKPEDYPVQLLILLQMVETTAKEVKKIRDRVQQGNSRPGHAAPEGR